MTRGSPLGFRTKGRDAVVADGPVAALDLGSTKISCVIAEPSERFVQGQQNRFAEFFIIVVKIRRGGDEVGNMVAAENVI